MLGQNGTAAENQHEQLPAWQLPDENPCRLRDVEAVHLQTEKIANTTRQKQLPRTKTHRE
jgi:hypothetical protein